MCDVDKSENKAKKVLLAARRAHLPLILGLGVTLLSGCGPTAYRNYLNPSYGQAEFDRDWYQCRQENTHYEYGLGRLSPVVNEEMVRACLAARGWRPARK
jgi:hypothetical protein